MDEIILTNDSNLDFYFDLDFENSDPNFCVPPRLKLMYRSPFQVRLRSKVERFRSMIPSRQNTGSVWTKRGFNWLFINTPLRKLSPIGF